VGVFVLDEGRSGTSDSPEKSDRESELREPNLPITINPLPASYRLRENLVRAHIIDQIEGAVVSTDPVGNIATWSRGAEQMYGYSAQEVVGRYIGLLFPHGETDPREFQIEAGQLLNDEELYRTELIAKRKDGQVLVS
jgi:PAS domain S-box-containing protein